MQITSSDILGKKIITENEGKQVATADDLFFDSQKKSVMAILSGANEGLENAKAVPLSKIKSIKDVIMLKSEKDLVPALQILKPEKDDEGKARTLVGSDMITDQGQELGDLKELTFDAKSGQIAKSSTIKNGSQKTAKIEKIVTSSPEITIVKGQEEKKGQENPLEQIKKMFQ